MTALTAHYHIPPTQNTAPVIEFRCLWTSDLRRKQKRWQDGRLKLHTFNNRVMVYDEKSNFVGDTHWRKEQAFGDGDEIELERGGILVSIGESIGRDDQDLTELIDKRLKERRERVQAKHTGFATTRARHPGYSTPSTATRPKPLHTLLGAPSGHYGRAAVSSVSPFEQRQNTDERADRGHEKPPAKRCKRMDSHAMKEGYARSLTGVNLSLSTTRPRKDVSFRHEPSRPKSVVQRIETTNIDLTMSDSEQPSTGEIDHCRERRFERPIAKARMLEKKQERFGKRFANKLIGTPVILSASHSAMARTSRGSNISAKKPICRVESRPWADDELTAKAQWNEKRTEATRQNSVGSRQRRVASSSPYDSSLPQPRTRPSKAYEVCVSARQREPTEDSDTSENRGEAPPSLRIRPRAPPKLMMLMHRSNARPNAQNDPSDTVLPSSGPLPSGQRSSRLASSQATKQLQSFRQKQEEIVSARLNGRRPNLVQPMSWAWPEPDQMVLNTDDEETTSRHDIRNEITTVDVDLATAHDVKNATRTEPTKTHVAEELAAAKARPEGSESSEWLYNNTTIDDDEGNSLHDSLPRNVRESAVLTKTLRSPPDALGPRPPQHPQPISDVGRLPSTLITSQGDKAGSPDTRSVHPTHPLSQKSHTPVSRSTYDVPALLASECLDVSQAPHGNEGNEPDSEAVRSCRTPPLRKKSYTLVASKGISSQDVDRQAPAITAEPKAEPEPSGGGNIKSAQASPTFTLGCERSASGLTHTSAEAAVGEPSRDRRPKQSRSNELKRELISSTSDAHSQIAPPQRRMPATVLHDPNGSESRSERGPWSREAFDLFGSWQAPG